MTNYVFLWGFSLQNNVTADFKIVICSCSNFQTKVHSFSQNFFSEKARVNVFLLNSKLKILIYIGICFNDIRFVL